MPVWYLKILVAWTSGLVQLNVFAGDPHTVVAFSGLLSHVRVGD
jgi:hypothetical protein